MSKFCTHSAMPPGKPRTKTAVLTLRVEPRVKVAVELAAQHAHRSVTNLIEVLILDHCKQAGLEPVIPGPKESEQ